MRDFVDLGGTTPPMEDCAQVGTYDYMTRARSEARVYIDQLRRTLGPEPDGASLGIKSHPHDFGTYLTVVCYYDDARLEAAAYAQRCDEIAPEEWDEAAKLQVSSNREELSDGHLD